MVSVALACSSDSAWVLSGSATFESAKQAVMDGCANNVTTAFQTLNRQCTQATAGARVSSAGIECPCALETDSTVTFNANHTDWHAGPRASNCLRDHHFSLDNNLGGFLESRVRRCRCPRRRQRLVSAINMTTRTSSASLALLTKQPLWTASSSCRLLVLRRSFFPANVPH